MNCCSTHPGLPGESLFAAGLSPTEGDAVLGEATQQLAETVSRIRGA